MRCGTTSRRGVVDRHSPFSHTRAGYAMRRRPAVRTVVLRDVQSSARMLTCHTDVRSAKAAELDCKPRAAWLFYDRTLKLQVRLSGITAVAYNDARAEERWRASPQTSRRVYCTSARPRSQLHARASGLRAGLEERVPTREESERYGKGNFAVLDTVVDRIDCLELAACGHRRAQFRWREEAWEGMWVVP